MAQERNSRDNDSRSRNEARNLPPLANVGKGGDEEWEELEVVGSAPAASSDMLKKLKNIHWGKKNPNLVVGVAAGAVVLLIVLLVGWQLGWFSSSTAKTKVAVRQPPAAAKTDAPHNIASPPVGNNAPPTAGQPTTQTSGPTQPTPWSRPPNASQPAAAPPSGQLTKEGPDKDRKPPLPDDMAKWTKEDDARARRENDPRLLQAISGLGEKSHGSEPAAERLTDLLKPLPSEPPQGSSPTSAGPASPPSSPISSPPGGVPPNVAAPPPASYGPPSGRPGYGPPSPTSAAPPGYVAAGPIAPPHNQAELTKTVETVVIALGENGSEPAQKALEQILAGTLTTDDDKVAVETALKVMVAHPCPENNALLLRVLIAPESLRPADRQGPWPAKDLRAKAFELIKSAASGELRARLAEALADRLVRLATGDPIRELLLAPDPLNCSAQLVLYEKASATREMKTKLEQQLTNYSSLALARLLRIAEETPAGGGYSPMGMGYGGPGMGYGSPSMRYGPSGGVTSLAGASSQIDANSGCQLAALLWSEKFCGLLESQLDDQRPLERQSQLVALAATIPQDSTRAALAKLFRKRWNDGPKGIEGVGFPDRMTADPGLLVLLKMFPRREVKTGRGMAGTPARGPRPGRTSPTAGRPGEVLSPAQRKEQAEQDWMAVSSRLVTAWCARFQAAAAAKEKAAAESGNLAGDVAPKLPAEFVLGADAKVLATYNVIWPDEVPTAMSSHKPSLLEIHYVRAEETGNPRKVLGFYLKQMQIKLADVRGSDNRSAWLDGIKSILQTGHRRSVDVVITRNDNQPGQPSQPGEAASDDEEADLVVEILSIEIKDPLGRD